MAGRAGGAQAIFVAAGLAVAGVAVEVSLALAANPATAAPRWPGVLDLLRVHPWRAVGILATVAAGLAVVAVSRERQAGTVAQLPPPPPAVIVPQWVVERAEAQRVVAAVLSRRRRRAVGITTGLRGAGGFGKSTVARLVCADQRVRRRFRGRVYFVTVGREVRSRAQIAAKVAEVTRFITGDEQVFADPGQSGAHLGRLLESWPPILLVLDDIWETEQLAPFLIGAPQCIRLVTTRAPGVLPQDAVGEPVDQMSVVQARRVLTWDLPTLPGQLAADLLKATGRWPLLVRLANRTLAASVATGADPGEAAGWLLARLRAGGPGAVDGPSVAADLDDPERRNTVVQASMQAAVGLLPRQVAARFAELGVFAGDEAVPIRVIARLWRVTAGLSEDEVRRVCRDLAGLSLLALDPSGGGSIVLHDVIRDYVRAGLGAQELVRVNRVLLDTLAPELPTAPPLTGSHPEPDTAWWQLDGYLLDHLIEHMLAADRAGQAEALACDLRWVLARLQQHGPIAVLTDLARFPGADTAARARELAQAAHLLAPIEPAHALADILLSRLHPLPAWRQQVEALWASTPDPTLRNQTPLPDLPDPRFYSAIAFDNDLLSVMAIGPDGSFLVIALWDGPIRIWDRATGRSTALTGNEGRISTIAISPDGTWFATGEEGGVVRIWDRLSDNQVPVPVRHLGDVHALAISPDGCWLAIAGQRGIRIWDRVQDRQTAAIGQRAKSVSAIAISPDATWLASIDDGPGTVRIWDRSTGRQTAVLGRNGGADSLVISPDGNWIATTCIDSVRIWDRATWNETSTWSAPDTRVNAVAVAPDGTWFALADGDGSVRICDIAQGCQTGVLDSQIAFFLQMQLSADGAWLATGGWGGEVRLWNLADARNSQPAQDADLRVMAVSADGTLIAGGTSTAVHVYGVDGSNIATLSTEGGRVHALTADLAGAVLVNERPEGIVHVWRCDALLDPGAASPSQSGWRPVLTIRTSIPRLLYIMLIVRWLWCLATRRRLGRTRPRRRDRIDAAAISSNRARLAIAGSYARVQIWNPTTGERIAALPWRIGAANELAISPDGTWLVTEAYDSKVRLWNTATGRPIATLAEAPESTRALTISDDGTIIAAVSKYGALRVWDRTTTQMITALSADTEADEALAISPDCALLANVGGSLVQLWDLGEKRLVAATRVDGSLSSCAWLPDSRTLAIGGEHGLYLYCFYPGQPEAAQAGQ